jgi:CheY-like chemotaxis protein
MDLMPILVGEDDANDAILLQRAFAKAGILNPMQVVTDGGQVLEYLRGKGSYADRTAHPFPALLLLDIKMPIMTGLETLAAIRKDAQLKRLIVIMLTASNHSRDINQAFDLRANSYLVKPPSGELMTKAAASLKNYWLTVNQYPSCPAQ